MLEAELRSAQTLEAVGRLAGGIAHDFNNLLMTVRGNVSLLRPWGPGEPEVENVELDEIDAAVDHAASLTRQLLAFSQRQVIRTQRLELGKVVDVLTPRIRHLLGPAVELHVESGGECWLEADPGQVEEIVMNLTANSGDAMPEGGVLTLRMFTADVTEDEARREPRLLTGAYVTLVVEDTGCGMSAETLTHAFEPFFTTKPSGGGLGLSTVFGIATQLGGHVAVRSTPGLGTRFDVCLPRATSAPDGAPPAGLRASRRQSSVLPGSRGQRILVVDDEVPVQRALQRILLRDGYDVLTAGEGVEALELEARTEGPIHLLLTDVMMPRMDGRELMLRFAERRPGAAVVCMSGFVDDDLRASLPLQDCTFLAKPFSIGSVLEAVHQELELRLPV
ncbi:MAG: hybrid sensor histidine kinase/response regulator [Gemmatimonadetes bacterium]|nr:hybrid sensor histidine kinase/response regulator [Gemmatimonadota bacterium]